MDSDSVSSIQSEMLSVKIKRDGKIDLSTINDQCIMSCFFRLQVHPFHSNGRLEKETYHAELEGRGTNCPEFLFSCQLHLSKFYFSFPSIQTTTGTPKIVFALFMVIENALYCARLGYTRLDCSLNEEIWSSVPILIAMS